MSAARPERPHGGGLRLRSLRLAQVRGVDEREVTLLPGGAGTRDGYDNDDRGVIIVEGPNEAGKTTLADALDVLLRYKDSSQHRDVRSLRTEGRDEGPWVEADLQTGPYRVTYRKRFLRRTATELEVHTPHGERLSGDEAHDRMLAILDETIDRELWESLRLDQTGGLEQADLGSSSGLASALQQRTGASAISDRDLHLLEQVRVEHRTYFTDAGNPRKDPLGAARERVETLERQHADIERRLDELAGQVELAGRLERELPTRREQQREAAEHAAQLAERKREVEALAQHVTERERARDAAAAHAEQASAQAQARIKLVAELEEVQAELRELTARLDTAERELASARARQEAALQQLADGRERQHKAREVRERAQADADHLRGLDELATLRQRLERATAARAQLREADAVMADATVDDELLGELRTARRELDRTQAALEAASPELRFTATSDVDVAADDHVRSLRAGETIEWQVQGMLRMAVGDVAEVTVRAGAGTEEASTAHTAATERFEELLRRAGAAELEDAELAHRRRRDAQHAATTAHRDLDAALDGATTDELTERRDHLEHRTRTYAAERGDDPPLPADLDDAAQALAAAQAAEREADAAVAGPERDVEHVREEQEARRDEAVTQRTTQHELERRVSRLSAELAESRSTTADEALAATADAAAGELAQADAALETARAELADADPEAVRAQADNAAAVADDARHRVTAVEQQLRDVYAEIRARGGEGLHEQREGIGVELADARAELDSLERRAAAVRLLAATLERHRAEVRDRYAAPIRDEIVRFGRMLFGSDFDVELDDGLRVHRRHVNGGWLDLEQLSVGAREQLAMLGRLACATLLADAGGVLLFDDALGNTDPQRLEAIGTVLRLAGECCQVVVLTCYPDRYRHVGGATRVRLG